MLTSVTKKQSQMPKSCIATNLTKKSGAEKATVLSMIRSWKRENNVPGGGSRLCVN